MSLTFTALAFSASLVAHVPLAVRTYDAAGVPPRALDQARATATVALAAAGIRPIWHPCHAGLCISRPKRDEISIRIVKATGLSEPGSLGFSAIDGVAHAGTLATVYFDRVEALASDTGVDRGELLGRVVAHEIGHLLLGTSDHASIGLMRAKWTNEEIRRRVPLDWRFSAQESAEMQRRFALR
jgi:hypothetical protein